MSPDQEKEENEAHEARHPYVGHKGKSKLPT